VKENAPKKIELIGDGGFASEENSALAKENEINFITTSLTGTKPPEIFADFEINSEEYRVERCPAGNEPISQGRNQLTDTYRIVMEKDQCANCPHKAECKSKITKKSAVVSVSAKKVKHAKTVREISSKEYAVYRNSRNAVEGFPSVLRRRYDVDEMPVFGIMKSKLRFGFKVAAVNFKNLVKYTRGQCACQDATFIPREQCVQM
jgi:hypothetical protein